MKKKSVLSTLRFVLFTLLSVGLLFTAVYVTILNTYKPVVKAYINGDFVGYFSSEKQFDEVFNDLVTEKRSFDENVKVYLDSEPTFETCYIRDSLLKEQNVYTNLRSQVRTEYTVYDVVVNGEQQMTFTAESQATEYAEKLKGQVSNVSTDVKLDKVSELENITSPERAETILADIVDRNKPIEIPKTKVYTGLVIPIVNGPMVWPSSAAHTINCKYGEYYGHTGIDLNAPSNTPVRAFTDGTVTFSGWQGGYGWCVKIQHENGLTTLYGHNSRLVVSAGQHVNAGDIISYSGSTGNSTGPHLHFETRVNGISFDPWVYLSTM